MVFRVAQQTDIDTITAIMADAVEHLGAQGIDQWQRGYPRREDVAKDVERGVGRVLSDESGVVGYCAVIYTGEATYAGITGRGWSADEPYAVLHRMCVAQSHIGRGCATEILHRAESDARECGFDWFRIDTHPDNMAMQRVIRKCGFEYRGDVIIESRRLAYEKKILQNDK